MPIRNAESSDCESIAQMHKVNLDKSFLGTLGVAFLKILYQALLLYPGGFVIVSEANGEIAGFVSGVDNVKKFYNFFLCKKWLSVIFAILPKLFTLNNLKKILETSRYGGHDSKVVLPEAELLSIAVNEKYRGQGISVQLFERLGISFAATGINKFKIIVGAELLPARKFYQKVGCVEISTTEVHKGATSIVLTYSIPTKQAL